MNQRILKDYLSFTRKERVAALCLVLLMLLLFVCPSFFPKSKPVKLSAEYLLPAQTLRTETIDALPASTSGGKPWQKKYLQSSLDKSSLFYFDPNELSPAGWERIGLRPATIRTIQHYLAKGGKFRSPQDLGKIYGLHEEEAKRLQPYVIIRPDARLIGKKLGRIISAPLPSSIVKSRSTPAIIDINTADSNAFIALPGIGSKLASRIIRFREGLGGFYSVHQMSEVYGLPDSTFVNIKSRLVVTTPAAGVFDLNTVSEELLKKHPYVRWDLARRILAFRNEHGPFQSVEALRQLEGIDAAVFEKMAPYFRVLPQ